MVTANNMITTSVNNMIRSTQPKIDEMWMARHEGVVEVSRKKYQTTDECRIIAWMQIEVEYLSTCARQITPSSLRNNSPINSPSTKTEKKARRVCAKALNNENRPK